TARHAQRIKDDFNRATIFEIGHVLDRDNLGDHTLIPVTTCHLVADRQFTLLRYADAHHLLDTRREITMFLAGEHFDINDLTGVTMRQAQRGVFHFARFFAEDGPQELLFRAEFFLALWCDLTDQNVIRADFRTDADDA